jgi:NADH:ubiquinone oxidoreductase subunit 2 (subunit N)
MNRIDLGSPLGVAMALLPEILLSAWALIVLLVVSWRHETDQDSRLAGWLGLAGLLVSGAGLAALWVGGASPEGLPQMIALDPFRYGASAIVLLAAAGTVLISLG